MRSIPHRVPIFRRPAGSGGALPRGGAAPVLTHHTSDSPADDGDAGRPCVLVLDGPPGTPFVWHRVLPVLRSRGVQTGTVKRPEHSGATGRVADPFDEAVALARLLDDQLLSPAVIVGHNVGVEVAMAMAVAAPRHVRALVLVGPPARLRSISLLDRMLAAPMLGPVTAWLGFRVTGLALHLPALRRAVLTAQVGRRARDDKALVREIAFGTLWRNFVREERRLVGDARRRNQQVAGIDCAVVIVTANPERTGTRGPDRALRRLLPGADVIVSAAAGPSIPMDQPECVADAVFRALHIGYRTAR